MSDDEPTTIECETHGSSKGCVVCCHHVRTKHVSVGFVEISSDPDDLQAWCDDCEQMFLREDGKTDAFRAFNDFAIVCTACYAQIKALHSNPRGSSARN